MMDYNHVWGRIIPSVNECAFLLHIFAMMATVIWGTMGSDIKQVYLLRDIPVEGHSEIIYLFLGKLEWEYECEAEIDRDWN